MGRSQRVPEKMEKEGGVKALSQWGPLRREKEEEIQASHCGPL